jgi:hypothetical protein
MTPVETATTAAIRLLVDPSNPGQFFACCGLLELADRLWKGAAGWFVRDQFLISSADATAKSKTLQELVSAFCGAAIEQLDEDDDTSSRMRLGGPFLLTLDWWHDRRSGGNRLKVWAGRMSSVRIARAMQSALANPAIQNDSLLNFGAVVFDPIEKDKKVEPYYFDSRRGVNAQSRDIGFAPDALQMTTTAFPAVEILCLIGLQRCRPRPAVSKQRVFDYHTWSVPYQPEILPAAIDGLLASQGGQHFRFENSFRTDQKKHKAFLPAELIGGSK